MNGKKPYSPPQLFQVELNHEQAILSACELAATSVQDGGGAWCRTPTHCKQATNLTNHDSGARPS